MKQKIEFAAIIVILLLSFITAWILIHPNATTYYNTQVTEKVSELEEQWGIASWYDYKFVSELEWKDGVAEVIEISTPCFAWEDECYTHDKLYAASRKYERGTHLRVTNLANRKTVDVRVTDYIEHPERVIDLTSYAFSQIADLKVGLIDVRIEEL